ncbi:MAG: hypothetical protein GWP08_01415 [Nitrospiraceae bacterium]|nr:hypothetical protein [Nitrospiraceae bacterium]
MESYLLAITIGVIFLTTIIGPVWRRRTRDRCLRSFDGSKIVLVENDGKHVWGRLCIYATGFELLYDQPQEDEDGISKYSYIRYQAGYSTIRALWRYPDEMTPEEKRRRAKLIRLCGSPPLYARLWRWWRNVMGTLRDAFLQTAHTLLGRVVARSASSTFKSQEAQLKNMSSELIDHAANAYEPILERHFGRRVVLELVEGEEVREYVGLLRNYTATFVELADIHHAVQYRLATSERGLRLPGLEVTCVAGGFRLANTTGRKVQVDALAGPDDRTAAGVTVSDKAEILLERGQHQGEITHIEVTYARTADLIAPRTRAVVRHAAGPVSS